MLFFPLLFKQTFRVKILIVCIIRLELSQTKKKIKNPLLQYKFKLLDFALTWSVCGHVYAKIGCGIIRSIEGCYFNSPFCFWLLAVWKSKHPCFQNPNGGQVTRNWDFIADACLIEPLFGAKYHRTFYVIKGVWICNKKYNRCVFCLKLES